MREELRGKPQDDRAWPNAVEVTCRTQAPAGKQGLDQHLRGVERMFRCEHHMPLPLPNAFSRVTG